MTQRAIFLRLDLLQENKYKFVLFHCLFLSNFDHRLLSKIPHLIPLHKFSQRDLKLIFELPKMLNHCLTETMTRRGLLIEKYHSPLRESYLEKWLRCYLHHHQQVHMFAPKNFVAQMNLIRLIEQGVYS